jgi:hypothetical protein
VAVHLRDGSGSGSVSVSVSGSLLVRFVYLCALSFGSQLFHHLTVLAHKSTYSTEIHNGPSLDGNLYQFAIRAR